jgi:cell division protein ZapE
MTPIQRYQAQLDRPGFTLDSAQQGAIEQLEQLHLELARPRPAWQWRRPAPRGLYLWGPVGRGKTLLMDIFHAAQHPGTALRLHFHRFMARIHRELTLESGKADPLRHIAHGLARQYRVLCFDEVQVSDIGDAMLLGRLFDQLLQSGVTLVATSNQPPGELYPDGLQRERFLPAIRLLEQKLQVQALDGGRDHRRRPQPQADVLLRAPADAQLARHFANLTGLAAADGAPGQAPARSQLTLCNRPISVHARHSGVLWLTFSALCQGSRSSLDYIELAQRFHTLLLSDVPVFQGPMREGIKARGTEDGSFTPTTTGNRQVRWSAMDDPARRFISLIDELYDRNVTLYLSAEAEPESLYQQGQLQFEFQRTLSRLIEMQSQDYLLRPHRP